MSSFKDSLKFGQVAEGAIAKWLMGRGAIVLPVYEKEIDTGKGPQVFALEASYVAPDVLVYKHGRFFFAECKRKTAFSWYRKKRIWTTGIDFRHYKEYIEVSRLLGVEVYLFFLHMGGIAKDSPPSPSGLFYNSLSYLSAHVNHTSNRWANGMVYWSKDDLIKVADLGELEL